jgi:hypothetical protein
MRPIEPSKIERGSQDSNLESPVLETGALASWATAPWEAMLAGPRGKSRLGRPAGFRDAGGGT